MSLPTLGWREWLSLPELGIPDIKAKVDTGARTSALHAFFLEPFERDGREWVRFQIHPLQRNLKHVVECEARVKDRREVRDSGGHQELRYVIETLVKIGDREMPLELTLTDRESMKFRMLLGRTALCDNYAVDSGASYLSRPKPRRKRKKEAS